MKDRSLIVARMQPDHADAVAQLFATSDQTALPRVLGVARRNLFTSGGELYFHYVEFDGSARQTLTEAAERADFRRLSEQLSPFVRPYDPATWRSPQDALARQFYSWTPDGGPRR